MMGIKQKRARYKEEFRREILDAARELFISEGYEKFSLRRLAEKIDYSPTTIYLYFKGKDDLLFAICEEVAEQFLANLNRIGTMHTDPLEALQQALLYLVEFGFNNPNQYKVFFFTNPTVYGPQEDFMEMESMARDSYFAFRKIVQNGIETGSLREMDPEVLTQALAVATHGLIAMTLYCKSFPWADRYLLAHTLVDGLLRGFRK
ncbi:MAG: TetR/AcrR family transcriptional regulator [Alphaproteobacteria bacterium]|uniref:TetR/AcrR family transcriptional regulator n=1 Tax=Candidatus Nitrobium versatile TaxID=2884831 RepID=A0A953M3S5_9BACT|nr:TetR/AcrR family transcriptional regulator [Candidatus Nitrobium versatile]